MLLDRARPLFRVRVLMGWPRLPSVVLLVIFIGSCIGFFGSCPGPQEDPAIPAAETEAATVQAFDEAARQLLADCEEVLQRFVEELDDLPDGVDHVEAVCDWPFTFEVESSSEVTIDGEFIWRVTD